MGRRTVLLIVAALIAALGTSLVFLYVRGVDARAAERYDAVEVLTAVEVIAPGESLEEAQAAGKIEMGTVTRGQVLDGVTTEVGALAGQVALTTVFPGEQIITGKFGQPGEQDALTIPDEKIAISVNLTDPARVAGFVTPGSEVAVFVSVIPTAEAATGSGEAKAALPFTRLLLPRVSVLGVGTTTVVSRTVTDESGEATTEELPKTLITLALSQEEAQKVVFAAANGEVAFGLLTDKSDVKAADSVTAENVFE